MRLGVAVSPTRQAGIPADARLSASKFVTISEEEMTLTAASRSAMLDELAGVVTHFSLHTSDPGQTGASEVSGGSYGRVGAVWGAATDFQVSASPAVFTIPAGTPRFVGFWSASSGGTFYGSAALASPSLQSAGSFTVPVIRVYLDAGDVAIATGVSSDELRLLLHDGGLLQAPPHVDPLTVAYPAFGTYDAEQGGWPMRLPVTSPCKALAVTLGTNKSAMWFGARADGTETLWLDQRAATAYVSCPVPSRSVAGTMTLEGTYAGTHSPTSHAQIFSNIGANAHVRTDGKVQVYDGATTHVSAATITALCGAVSGDEIEWSVSFAPTTIKFRVRAYGAPTWVDAINTAGDDPSFSAPVVLGAIGTGQLVSQVRYLRWRDGDETAPVVAHFVPSLFPAGSRVNAATAVDEYGVTWTLTKPTAAATDEPRVVLPGARRFVMPGVAGESVSTPDSVANSITGDIDVRVLFEAGSFVNPTVSGQYSTFASKWETGGGVDESWLFRYYRVGALDQLNFVWNDGSAVIWKTQTVPTFVGVNGVRAALDVDNGSGSYVLRFYTTANGGETWDQIGVDVTGAATAIRDTASPVVIGARGVSPTGDLTTIDWTYAEIRDGIDGTVVSRFHVDDANPDSYTWVDPVTGQTNTVNHTTSPSRKVILVEEGQTAVQGDGVNDQLIIVGDLSVMDFVPADGLSLVARVRMHNTTSSYGRVMSAENTSNYGASIQRVTTNQALMGRVHDGTTGAQVGDTGIDNITYGATATVIAAFGSSDHEFYTGGVTRETLSTAVAAEPAATLPTFFRRADGGSPLGFDLLDFWIVRRRLSDGDVATSTTEMGF